MSDLSVIIFYSLCVISTLYVIVSALLRDRGKHLTRYILFFATMVLGWQIIQLFYHSSSSFEWSKFWFDIDLPFVALSSVAILLFALRLFSFRITPVIILLLCIIPGITTVLALGYNHNTFLRTSLEILQTWPRHVDSFVRGPWFWVHAAYCYIVVMLASGIALVQYRKVPKVYRHAAQQLILSIFISLIGNVLVLTEPFPVPIDFSLVGATLAIYPLYYSTRNNQGLEFLHKAKEDIFNEIDEGIVIADDTDRIIDANTVARHTMQLLSLSEVDGTYAGLTLSLSAKATHFEQVEKEGGGIDYYFRLPDESTRVLNMQEKEVLDKKGRRLALISISRDVTENRATLRQLAAEAGMDALTGLMNRNMLSTVQQELDTVDNLPITALMGDLNSLKRVNDTMGHQQGDIYLLLAAQILSASCPPNARIARIGGDEFLALLPHCASEQAEGIAQAIDQQFAALDIYPFAASISLGVCTKVQPDQSLDDIIKQADARMYLDKKRRNAARA